MANRNLNVIYISNAPQTVKRKPKNTPSRKKTIDRLVTGSNPVGPTFSNIINDLLRLTTE